MAFRDNSDALRARIDSLETNLGEAKAKISTLEDGEDYANTEALPPLHRSWKRRTRIFRGQPTAADQEKIVNLVQKTVGKQPVTTSSVGRILTIKSSNLEVTIAPTEDDKFTLIFDTYSAPHYVRSVAPMVLATLGAVGVGFDGSALGAAAIAAVGVAVSVFTYTKTKKSIEAAADNRTALFARLGTMLDEAEPKVRVENIEVKDAEVSTEEVHEEAVSAAETANTNKA